MGGPEDGPPNFMNMLQRWRQGLLRKAHMRRQRGASACVEELAANGLARGLEGFDDVEVLASGTFGVIRTGISKITKMKVAIKTVLPVSVPTSAVYSSGCRVSMAVMSTCPDNVTAKRTL